MNTKLIISFALGLLLSAVTLWLALRNVPLADLVNYLRSIRYGWVLPAVALVMLTFILRVYRWRLILEGAAQIGFSAAYHPLMIGFMINCVLPGRLGEIARPAILRQSSRVPLITGLATVAAERLFDIAMLIALFLAVFSSLADNPTAEATFGGLHLNQKTLQTIAWAMTRIGAVILAVLILFTIQRVRELAARLVRTLPRWPILGIKMFLPFTQRVVAVGVALIDNFAAGLTLISSPRRIFLCLLLTAAIWAATIFIYVVLAIGSPGIHLSFHQLTTVMVVVCFFIALPSAPGFWGLWEAGGVFALSLFGVPPKDALGFTLANHAVQLFPVIVAGLISAMLTSVNILRLTRDPIREVNNSSH
jgi:hypothetical protein